MADAADHAERLQREEIERALINRRDKDGLRAKGACYNCDEPLDAADRFCDADCREDWQKRVGNRWPGVQS